MPRFSQWRNGFPGLLWSIRRRESRLKLFSRWHLDGVDASLLLKNASYRKQAVMPEDYPLLVEFWDMIHAARPAAAIFRLRADAGRKPLMLQGWPEPGDEVYSGFLKGAFLPGGYGSECYNAQLSMRVGDADYPVFTIDLERDTIKEANAAADGLFMRQKRGAGLLTLDDVAPQDLGQQLMGAARQAAQDDAWSGTLMLGNTERGLFSAHVRLTPWGRPEERVVRVALVSVEDKTLLQPFDTASDEALRPGDLRPALESLWGACGPEVDGLMLSHIQSGRGKVTVFGVGRAFASLEWGAVHAYEGTIAQDIERFDLSSLLVEDTLDSVKSVDWALFAPQGVRSYYALPFYAEHGLHAVLILASRKAKTFGADADVRYADVAEAFGNLLRRWRQKP
jgi:hypothetical protein